MSDLPGFKDGFRGGVGYSQRNGLFYFVAHPRRKSAFVFYVNIYGTKVPWSEEALAPGCVEGYILFDRQTWRRGVKSVYTTSNDSCTLKGLTGLMKVVEGSLLPESQVPSRPATRV